MSSKFTAPLILSSALALGAMGFVACGDGGNSDINPVLGGSSSSAGGKPLSSFHPDPITAIQFSDFGVASSTLSRVKFKGAITIDLSDTNTVVDIDQVHITGIEYHIVNQNNIETGSITATLAMDYENDFVTAVSFQEIGLQTDLDQGYNECGNFELVVYAFIDDGYITSQAEKRIPFVRPEEKCREPESSSSEPPAVPGAPLDTFSVQINTKVNKCIDLTAQAVAAGETGDICLRSTSTTGAIELSSGTGIKFAVYDNTNDNVRLNDYSKNYLPENPTTDDFLYMPSSLKEVYPNFLAAGDVFFVGIAPTYVPNSGSAIGFYSFVVLDSSVPDPNGDMTISLLIYKAK